MPLLGLVDGERVVSSLLSDPEWEALRGDIRAKRRSLVLPCGFPGHAKTSKLGTRYFAHNPGGDGCSAGETAEHLLAKATIIAAARAVGWDAEPEARGDGWIADVMASNDAMNIVFEVQWSRQQLTEYRSRTTRYADAGIKRTAWFARHIDAIPKADKSLPVFELGITGDEGPTVRIESTMLLLGDAVARLLTGQIQHRDYYATGRPAEAVVRGTRIENCYRCGKPFGVWRLSEVRVRGRCGGLGVRERDTGIFATERPETDPKIREAGERLSREMGVLPARLGQRFTKSSGTSYMAFICPHCGAVCGDVFVAQEFEHPSAGESITVDVPATAVRKPHWCVAGDNGVCPPPPPEVVSELHAAEAVRHGTVTTGASVSPVRISDRIALHQVVGRMFGNRF